MAAPASSSIPLLLAVVGIPVLAAVAAALGFRGSDVLLGVDLGTTFSAVAYSDGGLWSGLLVSASVPAARVLANLAGELVTPSVVAVAGGRFLVGRAAAAHLALFPHEGVIDGKRVIGRRRSDAAVVAEARRHGGRLLLHPQVFLSSATGRPLQALSLTALAAESRLGRLLGLGGRAAAGFADAPAACGGSGSGGNGGCTRELAFAVPLVRQTAAEARALASHPCVDAGSLIEVDPLELESAGLDSLVADGQDGDELQWAEGESNDEDDVLQPHGRLPKQLLRLAERLGRPRRFLMLTPQAAACLLLGYLRESAQRALPFVALSKATACVPAEFDAVQSRATLEAFARAGLRVVRTLHEPTAAAAAYGLHQRADVHYVLVFDMGGGTLDVSVLFLGEGAFTVIGTAGDNSLGGEDFDDCLAAAMLRTASGEVSGVGSGSGVSTACAPETLSLEAERVKIVLSRDEVVEWRCPGPGDVASAGARGSAGAVSRADFERECEPLFARSLAPVQQALENANVRADEVDELVLVGGSSRLPGVRARLRDFFGGRELRTTVDPDLAVALGAAATRV